YVSSAVYGVDDLDHSGNWRVVPTYGSVWVPNAAPAAWAPYSTGRWIWDRHYGWTWVDAAPWGWAPCHYGRWGSIDAPWGRASVGGWRAGHFDRHPQGGARALEVDTQRVEPVHRGVRTRPGSARFVTGRGAAARPP